MHFDKIKLHFHEGHPDCLSELDFLLFYRGFPFYYCGKDYSFISCYFESVAGFTTTGRTVFALDELPRCLCSGRRFPTGWAAWESLCFWFPSFRSWASADSRLLSAEATGPSLEKIGGHFSDTGKFLYLTYISFSAAEFLLLALGPLSPFDALINTFSSISTAGLVITSSNARAFTSTYIRAVVMLFTILSSLNYTLYYFALCGSPQSLFKNIEVRVFGVIIAAATPADRLLPVGHRHLLQSLAGNQGWTLSSCLLYFHLRLLCL